MNMNKNVLAVAFKGQLYKNEATTTNYVYPESNKDWSMLLGSDPRKTISDLNINGDCYTIKITNRGIIYSYRRVLAGRSGSNCAMIMLLVEAPTRDGKILAEKLKELLKYAMDQTSADQINQNVLDEKMASFEELFYRTRKFTVSLNDETSESSTTNEAFFIYKSDEELFARLESPYQSTYKNFSCIHFVSVENNASPSVSSNMKLIATPLEKIYFLRFPQGVSEKNGKQYIAENELFTLVFRKCGYINEDVPLQLNGRFQKYFSIEEDVVSIKSAEDCKVEFKRKITLSVSDDQGNPIDNWNWKMNGANVNKYDRAEKGSHSWELPDGEYKVEIEANGFESAECKLDTRRKQDYDVKLKSSGSSRKVYLEPLWAKRDKKNHSYQEKPVTISYTQNSCFYRQFNEQLEGKENPTFFISRKRPPVAFIVFIGIFVFFFGVAVGYCVSHFIIGKKTIVKYDGKDYEVKGTCFNIESTNPLSIKDEKGNSVIDNVQVTVTNTNTGGQTVSDLTFQQNLEKHDIEYLNSNDIWMLDSLKSDKYMYFFCHVVANEGIKYADVDWSVYTGVTNSKWAEIYNNINRYIKKEGEDVKKLKYWELKKSMVEQKMLDLNEACTKISTSKSEEQRQMVES